MYQITTKYTMRHKIHQINKIPNGEKITKIFHPKEKKNLVPIHVPFGIPVPQTLEPILRRRVTTPRVAYLVRFDNKKVLFCLEKRYSPLHTTLAL
jgi:hypothetical protein